LTVWRSMPVIGIMRKPKLSPRQKLAKFSSCPPPRSPQRAVFGDLKTDKELPSSLRRLLQGILNWRDVRMRRSVGIESGRSSMKTSTSRRSVGLCPPFRIGLNRGRRRRQKFVEPRLYHSVAFARCLFQGHQGIGRTRGSPNGAAFALPLVGEARRAVRPTAGRGGKNLPDLNGPSVHWKRSVNWDRAPGDDDSVEGWRARGRVLIHPRAIRGGYGNRKALPISAMTGV
jgi:hypothetical protein